MNEADPIPPDILRLAGCNVDLRHRSVSGQGLDGKLSTREAELLGYLAARPGRDIERDELLQQVWGYGPGVISRTIDTTVRRLRSKIEQDPAQPVHLLTVQSVGYRFEPRADRRDPLLDRGFGLAGVRQEPSPNPEATNVQAAASSFVGRRSDLRRLADAFEGGGRLVSLLGPGGTGKTRLARRFAREVAAGPEPGAGAWFCDLSPAGDADAVAAVVGAILGVPPLQGGDQVERIGHVLAGRGRIFVVLDNFEQVAHAGPVTVGRWLADAPEARFLVTSRERLRIEGEAVLDLAPLSSEDAVRLFEERARGARADFRLDDASRGVAGELCRRLDCLPLAIELAAARVTVLSVDALLDRLDRRFRLLVGSGRGVSERQRTLRGAIAWSWDLLSESERTVLAGCSVFAGGFDAAAAEAVIELDDSDPDAP